jgi:hypothetical protein
MTARDSPPGKSGDTDTREKPSSFQSFQLDFVLRRNQPAAIPAERSLLLPAVTGQNQFTVRRPLTPMHLPVEPARSAPIKTQ